MKIRSLGTHWSFRCAASLAAIASVCWGSIPVSAFGQTTVPPVGTTPLVFDHVTVIDVEHGRAIPEQRVVIVGHRITTTGPAQQVTLPKQARVIDATGKYVIPGFWDMHVHAETGSRDAGTQGAFHRRLYERFIANGVTGIREMAQRWGGGRGTVGSRAATDSFRVWQRAIQTGTMIGPRGVGPSADVTLTQPFVRAFDNPDDTTFGVTDAIRVIDSLKAAGDAFVKFHGHPDRRDIFFAFLRESRRVGLPLVGHVPLHVTNAEAADSGMRSIEHSELGQCSRPPWMLPDFTTLDSACASTAQAYVRNGTWLTPTLAMHWIDDAHTAQTQTRMHHNALDSSLISATELWNFRLQILRTLHRLGVHNFLVGTDWQNDMGFEHAIVFSPGLSARQEIVLLVEQLELTPLEALQAATLNPARFLQATDSLGTVAPGKLADLVLLDANPLTDIANVLQLWGVVANGQYFDHAALVRMDPDAFTPGAGMIGFPRHQARATGSGGTTTAHSKQ